MTSEEPQDAQSFLEGLSVIDELTVGPVHVETKRIRAGYRILEGGADNDEVYNFALFHYASMGISYAF